MTAQKKSQRSLIITVPPEELLQYENAAFAALRSELELPGFRRGHVPENIARTHIPAERIFHDAAERAVAEKGSEAIEALQEEIVGEPKVEMLKAAQGNPLEFQITVDVLPEVVLKDWRKIRIATKQPTAGEEDVMDALENLRRSRAKLRAVLRPAAKGDLVEVDFVTHVDGVGIDGGSSKNHPVLLGEGRFLPGFEDAIIGMSTGEEKVVTLPFPKDWPRKEYVGKEGVFTITARNVQERLLPNLDDTFAQSLGQFTNLDALKTRIREGLLYEREEAERRRVRLEGLEQLARRIDIALIPDLLITQEIDRMHDEFRASIERYGIPVEEYLLRIGKKEAEFADDWRDGATKRVKAALVLRALAREENIMVTPEEVEARVLEILQQERGGENKTPRVDPEAIRSYTENILRNEKVMKLVERIVTDKETLNPKL